MPLIIYGPPKNDNRIFAILLIFTTIFLGAGVSEYHETVSKLPLAQLRYIKTFAFGVTTAALLIWASLSTIISFFFKRPQLILSTEGITFRSGTGRNYSANWDNLGTFELLSTSKILAPHIQAEIIGSHVSKNLETKKVFTIPVCRIVAVSTKTSSMDQNMRSLLQELNAYRTQANSATQITS